MSRFRHQFNLWIHALTWQDIAFLYVLLLGLGVRIYLLRYPIWNAEVSRDFLVASHMLRFHEFPSTGPWNGVFGALQNSPLYFYVLAVILLIKKSILTLLWANLLLQIATVAQVYILARMLFGKQTALIAGILFAFSWASLGQSYDMWQPHLMHPVLMASYILLALAHQRKKYSLLIWSSILLWVAGALHNSAFVIFPLYYIVSIGLLWQWKKSWKEYVGLIGVGVASALILYLPVMLFLKDSSNATQYIESPLGISLAKFWTYFSENTLLFLRLFFTNRIDSIPLYTVSAWITAGVFVFYCIDAYRKSNRKHLTYMLLFLLSILLLISATSLFQLRLREYYFTPIFSLFVILVAETTYRVFNERLKFPVLTIAFTAALILAFSSNLYFITTPNETHESFKAIRGATNAISADLESNGMVTNGAVKPFTIQGYAMQEALLWVPLEQKFNQRFTESTSIGNNYVPLHQSDAIRIFISCYSEQKQECLSHFATIYPAHVADKQIYHDPLLTIYSTKLK